MTRFLGWDTVYSGVRSRPYQETWLPTPRTHFYVLVKAPEKEQLLSSFAVDTSVPAGCVK